MTAILLLTLGLIICLIGLYSAITGNFLYNNTSNPIIEFISIVAETLFMCVFVIGGFSLMCYSLTLLK